MEEKQLVPVNIQIWDTFDLPLQEDAEVNSFYTANEIKHEVEKRIARLAALGSYYTISPRSITEYVIVDRKDSVAGIESIGEHKYSFKISKLATRKQNEKYLDTIIYHELCHILQVEALIIFKLLEFDNGGLVYDKVKKLYVDAWFFKDDYHTDIWYTFVDKVNSAFSVNPPIARFLNAEDEVNIFLEDTFKSDRFIKIDAKIMDDFSYLFKDDTDE